MAKLILLFSTLALFVLLANASIYRTTVELDEEEDSQIQGRCRREFRQQQHLRACQRFIRRRAIGGGVYEDDVDVDDETEDELDEADQMRPPALRRCCNQLRQVDRQCVCPLLRQAAHQQRIQGQVQGPYQVRQMFRVARNLPNICNIPVGTCPFSARPSYEVLASQ